MIAYTITRDVTQLRLAEAYVEAPGDEHRDPRRRPALVLTSAVRGRALFKSTGQPGPPAGFICEATPDGPLDRNASIPPSRQAALYVYADFLDIRRARATWGGFNPAANIPAAWNRTRSRRARPTAVGPPHRDTSSHRRNHPHLEVKTSEGPFFLRIRVVAISRCLRNRTF